jgi:hypothetical protein
VLTIPHCKESLSRAYVTAVVGRARHNVLWGREFDYGVDGSVRELALRGTRIRETGFGFDFQSKTTIDWFFDGPNVVYDLAAEAYNDLSERAGTSAFPFLLILLCLNKDDAKWLNVSLERLVMERCAFWTTLTGALTHNSGTCRIRIPSTNVFTPEVVNTLLSDIRIGALLP